MKNSVESLIKSAKTAAVFHHINPDADAVGSALAAAEMLKYYGVETVHCFSENPLNEKLLSLDGAENFNPNPLKAYELAVVVDCSELSRIGNNCAKIFAKCAHSVVFDHHIGKGEFCDAAVIDVKAGSATQVLYGFIKEFCPGALNAKMANYLYAGLVTDTGGFLFPSVSVATMEMAADLYKFDFNPSETARLLLRNNPMRAFKLKAAAMSNARFYDNGRIGLIIFTKKVIANAGAEESDTENIISEIINIDSVQIAFAMTEISGNAYKVSIRSKGRASALLCARCFGGGGHNAAAGCRVYGLLEDCIDKLVAAARDTAEDA